MSSEKAKEVISSVSKIGKTYDDYIYDINKYCQDNLGYLQQDLREETILQAFDLADKNYRVTKDDCVDMMLFNSSYSINFPELRFEPKIISAVRLYRLNKSTDTYNTLREIIGNILKDYNLSGEYYAEVMNTLIYSRIVSIQKNKDYSILNNGYSEILIIKDNIAWKRV